MQDLKELKSLCVQAAAPLGYASLKPQQLEAIVEFVGGKDVFVVLPTGFGKSLIYACMPLVFDTLHTTRGSMIIVITPLTAIMKDQVFTRRNGSLISCTHSSLAGQPLSWLAR